MTMYGEQWFVTIVVSVITTGGTLWATRLKGKTDVESSYLAEMRNIIEAYQKDKAELKAEKAQLQELVDRVKKINTELQEELSDIKMENRELRAINTDLKLQITHLGGTPT